MYASQGSAWHSWGQPYYSQPEARGMYYPKGQGSFYDSYDNGYTGMEPCPGLYMDLDTSLCTCRPMDSRSSYGSVYPDQARDRGMYYPEAQAQDPFNGPYNSGYTGMPAPEFIELDTSNWFFIICSLHPDEFEQHAWHAAQRRGGGGFWSTMNYMTGVADVSDEETLQEVAVTTEGVVMARLQAMGYRARVDREPAIQVAPGMPPGRLLSGEDVFILRVVLLGMPAVQRHQHQQSFFGCCCAAESDSYQYSIARECSQLARRLPPDVSQSLQRPPHQIFVKVEGATNAEMPAAMSKLGLTGHAGTTAFMAPGGGGMHAQAPAVADGWEASPQGIVEGSKPHGNEGPWPAPNGSPSRHSAPVANAHHNGDAYAKYDSNADNDGIC